MISFADSDCELVKAAEKAGIFFSWNKAHPLSTINHEDCKTFDR